jgi:hypothetical protein
MMTDPAIATMAANLEAKTGRSLDAWIELVRAEDLGKHGRIVSYLKQVHGMTHGYANFVALQALTQPASGDELVAAQYTGKEALRPVYEAALSMATSLGGDVEVAPKKTYVSLRRNKQFALLKPATRTAVEVGLNLPGVAATERLRAAGGMCSHTVRVSTLEEVDDELQRWLRAAYEQA